MNKLNYGDIIIATPATHITHLGSEESLGTNILKGYNTGLISFGQSHNLLTLVNYENQESGLEVSGWGYHYPYVGVGGPRTNNLYISCESWIAFEIDITNSPVWESWLVHFHPTKGRANDKKEEPVKLPTYDLETPDLEQNLIGPFIISMDISKCTSPIIDQVNKILESHPGDREVHLRLIDGKKSTILKLDEALKVTPSSRLKDNLKSLLGPDCLND